MEMHSPGLLLFLRLLNIILITLAVSAWVIFYKRYRLIMALAPITWLIHLLVYGVYRFITIDTVKNFEFTTTWTALLMTHAIILLLLSAILSLPTKPPIPFSKENREEENKR